MTEVVPDIYTSVETFKAQAYTRVGEDRLGAHLEDTYDTKISAITKLDGGVFQADRPDGPSWVARLFPRARPVAAIEGDGEILQFVEKHGFPAERCIADPLSVFEEQGVLVTEHVAGANGRGDSSAALLHRLGDLLGQLHSIPLEDGAMSRAAGSWHSLSIQGGGRSADVAALTSLLTDAKSRAPSDQQPYFDQLCADLAALDVGDGLPVALTHPDFCGANVIKTPEGEVVLVDWTGAGSAPRIGALGYLLSTTGGNAGLIDAVASGYRSHVRLTDDELSRLPDSLRAFHFVLDCWGIIYWGAPAAQVAAKVAPARQFATTVATQAREAFTA